MWSRDFLKDEGFKNVSLGNVLSASYGGTKKNTFVSDADNDILKKYKVFQSNGKTPVNKWFCTRCPALRSRLDFTSSWVMALGNYFSKVI